MLEGFPGLLGNILPFTFEVVLSLSYVFAGATLPNYHRRDDFNKEIYFLPVLETESLFGL